MKKQKRIAIEFILASLFFWIMVFIISIITKTPISIYFCGSLYAGLILAIIIWNLSGKISIFFYIISGTLMLIFSLTDNQDLLHKISECIIGLLSFFLAYTTIHDLNNEKEKNN